MYSISGRRPAAGRRRAPRSPRPSRAAAPLADQRLVDVEVEEPDLGVGDLADRLGVDADELQEGDEREPGREHVGDVLERLHVVLVQRSRRAPVGRAEQGHHPVDQLGLEPGPLRRLLLGVAGPRDVEQVLGVAEGELAFARGLLDRFERVAALAHPRDHPGLRRRARSSARPDRDDPLLRPALQRRLGDTGDLARLAQRDGVVLIASVRGSSATSAAQASAAPRKEATGPTPSPAGFGPLCRPAALIRLAGASVADPSRRGMLPTADPLPAELCQSR